MAHPTERERPSPRPSPLLPIGTKTRTMAGGKLWQVPRAVPGRKEHPPPCRSRHRAGTPLRRCVPAAPCGACCHGPRSQGDSSMTHRFIPRLSPEEIARQQLEGLRFTVRQAFRSPPVPQTSGSVRRHARRHHLAGRSAPSAHRGRGRPARRLPLPLLCVPEEDVVRIHASSGTTGKRRSWPTRPMTWTRSPCRWPAATRWRA